MSRFTCFGLACLGVSLWPGKLVAAQLEWESDEARVFSIQERPYRLGHEFQLGIGVLPLDAFYVGVVGTGSYTYHFSDFWAWEIAGGGYSLNFGTGLQKRLHDEFNVEPVNEGGDRISTMVTTSLVVKPLFGKLAVLNSDILFSETYFMLGLGPLRRGQYWLPTVDLGMGLRFWSGPSVSWRLDIRDYLVFARLMPENALLIMVSASLNYISTVVAPGEP